ncbi:MAG TPA: hypothetical protein PKE45_21485, partial [Caldilineaceae bacterium]|nr:hypothetical protein [Caldilineaceae bacterium]
MNASKARRFWMVAAVVIICVVVVSLSRENSFPLLITKNCLPLDRLTIERCAPKRDVERVSKHFDQVIVFAKTQLFPRRLDAGGARVPKPCADDVAAHRLPMLCCQCCDPAKKPSQNR